MVQGVLGLLKPGDKIWLDGRTVQVTAVDQITTEEGAPGVKVEWVDMSADSADPDRDGQILGENRQLVEMVD